MEKETAQLPVSPQEIQIEAPSFIDKIKLHKFKILVGVLGVLVFVGAVFGAYKLGQRQARFTSRSIPSQVMSPTPIPSLTHGSLTNIIGKILVSPQQYLDKRVKIVGYYRGWDLLDETGTHPPVTRSDWVVKDASGAIYVEAGYSVPTVTNLEPWAEEDTDEIIFLEGVVKINPEGIPYIQPLVEEEICVKTDTGETMDFPEAMGIALQSECVEEGGAFLEKHFCNESTGTWWIDLYVKKEGCAPACVIDVSTKKAEINWRCTGFGPLE